MCLSSSSSSFVTFKISISNINFDFGYKGTLDSEVMMLHSKRTHNSNLKLFQLHE